MALQPVVILERFSLNMTKGLKANWGPLHQLAASMVNEWDASQTAGTIMEEIVKVKEFEHRAPGKFKIPKIKKDAEEKSQIEPGINAKPSRPAYISQTLGPKPLKKRRAKICFNCSKEGHHYASCSWPKTTFCMRCGQKGVIK